MNTNPVRKILTALAVVVFFVLASHFLSNSTKDLQNSTPPDMKGALATTDITNTTREAASSSRSMTLPSTQTSHSLEETVSYLRVHHALPDYYLTKKAAAEKGWLPSKGNLCDVTPHMEIGGNVFTNSQKLLPAAPGRIWYEADFDYTCGNRNAKRILYSSDGLIYTTTDHYRTVVLVP